MNPKCILLLLTPILCTSLPELLHAQNPSALDAKSFESHWFIEAENDLYSTRFMNDTLEIIAPKGLTLWRKEKMKGNVTISYYARVMSEGHPEDRLSDLNCFWKASDPHAGHILDRAFSRQGVFARYYALQLYYMGYGGNYNTTTRFRRYDGNADAITDISQRPPVITEYTDTAHLLQPNKWYHIVLKCDAASVRFYIDNRCLVDYTDPHPLQEGWFGFRTTWSRTQITGFTYVEE